MRESCICPRLYNIHSFICHSRFHARFCSECPSFFHTRCCFDFSFIESWSFPNNITGLSAISTWLQADTSGINRWRCWWSAGGIRFDRFLILLAAKKKVEEKFSAQVGDGQAGQCVSRLMWPCSIMELFSCCVLFLRFERPFTGRRITLGSPHNSSIPCYEK